jgi:outer membrane protein OmpA-like peptidoglycan-associated protein
MKTILSVCVLSAAASLYGCATASPPQNLIDARASYDRARNGPAAQMDPAGLHAAKESLDAAEQWFVKDGDSQETSDMAYAAIRRAETAEATARARQADKERRETIAQMQATQAQALSVTSAELGQTRRQLEDEAAKRAEAERRAAQAAADLAAIAKVKQEPRGMVITLSGSVLFASGKSELLPAAQSKLNDVASALSKQDPDSKITVEGYTDSQGPASFNQDLSQRRAESVRGYLIAHGIAADRITAQGFGPQRPVADNASAEGRADNRRVEIVVQQGQRGSSSDADRSGPSTTRPTTDKTDIKK